VGIDVSKAKLDVALRFDDGEKHFIVSNDASGLRTLLQHLRRVSCRIVLESTGRYHILCAFRLAQAGLDVRVINPIEARRYITASVRKKKTDKTDASVLAHVAMIERDIPRFTATKTDILIRQKMGLVCSLTRHIQSLHSTMRGYHEFQEVMRLSSSMTEGQIQRVVEKLRERKSALEVEIGELVAQDEQRREHVQLAASIPGISPFLASLLCHMLRTDCESPKQWIHFVGLNVSERQSGQWRGRGKLSKRGNAYLRKRLFCAAWGAALRNNQFRAYYEKLRADGKSYKEALIVIARKQLRILFAVLRNGVPFSPEYCVLP
jgi:transposase